MGMLRGLVGEHLDTLGSLDANYYIYSAQQYLLGKSAGLEAPSKKISLGRFLHIRTCLSSTSTGPLPGLSLGGQATYFQEPLYLPSGWNLSPGYHQGLLLPEASLSTPRGKDDSVDILIQPQDTFCGQLLWNQRQEDMYSSAILPIQLLPVQSSQPVLAQLMEFMEKVQFSLCSRN